jgi:hypothetical protein
MFENISKVASEFFFIGHYRFDRLVRKIKRFVFGVFFKTCLGLEKKMKIVCNIFSRMLCAQKKVFYTV